MSGGKVTGAKVSQATGGKGDRLMSEREPDNSLPPSDKTAGQNVMEGKNMSEAGYRCVCLNARSIVNKKNELNIMVEDIDPHIIGITE